MNINTFYFLDTQAIQAHQIRNKKTKKEIFIRAFFNDYPFNDFAPTMEAF